MSTIIIRLQNLPLSAKAADIREFFGDLKIPKGSVNIVGGPQGDAFIGFASDEDARLAMLLDGRLLHNSKIHLMLSSRREMEQVIAAAQVQAQSVKAAVQLPVQHQTAPQMSAMGELNVLMKKELMPVKPEGSTFRKITQKFYRRVGS
jgi:RNA recognition motif-containing protein